MAYYQGRWLAMLAGVQRTFSCAWTWITLPTQGHLKLLFSCDRNWRWFPRGNCCGIQTCHFKISLALMNSSCQFFLRPLHQSSRIFVLWRRKGDFCSTKIHIFWLLYLWQLHWCGAGWPGCLWSKRNIDWRQFSILMGIPMLHSYLKGLITEVEIGITHVESSLTRPNSGKPTTSGEEIVDKYANKSCVIENLHHHCEYWYIPIYLSPTIVYTSPFPLVVTKWLYLLSLSLVCFRSLWRRVCWRHVISKEVALCTSSDTPERVLTVSLFKHLSDGNSLFAFVLQRKQKFKWITESMSDCYFAVKSSQEMD